MRLIKEQKLYENIYTTVNEAPVLSYINQPPVIVNQNLPISNPVTYPPQIGVQSTIKIPNPPIVNNQLVTSRDKTEDEIVRQRLEDLTMQMGELRVHAANAANQRNLPGEDSANVWCTNCKGQGHLKNDCPSPPALPPICRFCGGRHDVVSCKQIINPGQVQGRRQNQVYQVENDSNGNNNNYYNQNRSNNRNNQNNNWNRRPRYINNNFNSFAPLGNLQSHFNSNNFNNGGYRNNSNNPSRFMPQNPTSQNQGWSQMPYGNPNQGMPTYSGQVPSWVDETVICFNCNQPGHIKPNYPNARASIPYIPLCGNCKQNGHTAEECNGPKREGPRDNNNNGQGNNSRDNSAKLVQLPDDYDMKSNNNNNNNNNGNRVHFRYE
jgi:hypothetical protein